MIEPENENNPNTLESVRASMQETYEYFKEYKEEYDYVHEEPVDRKSVV